MRKLSKNKRITGLKLYCQKCKYTYGYESKEICKCNAMIYRAVIHVPGTKNDTRIKNLIAENIDDAIVELTDFKKELEDNNYGKNQITTKNSTPILLIECMAKYIAFLNNEDVPAHMQKVRGDDHIKDVERKFRNYIDALKSFNVDVLNLKFEDIGSAEVGYVHSYLIDTKKVSNKYYNNIIGILRIFTSHIIKQYSLHYSNPFEAVKRLKVFYEPKMIEDFSEFEQIITAIKPENGVKKYEKITKNLYHTWLANAYKLALYTGGRREEIVSLKWSDIVALDEIPQAIDSANLKINRANNIADNDKMKRLKNFIIYPEFRNFLLEIGYHKFKNTDEYILNPRQTKSRKSMMDQMSKGFSHFAEKAGIKKKMEYNILRKTFITNVNLHFGENARLITDHAGGDVLFDHYISKKPIQNDMRKNFKLFGK